MARLTEMRYTVTPLTTDKFSAIDACLRAPPDQAVACGVRSTPQPGAVWDLYFAFPSP